MRISDWSSDVCSSDLDGKKLKMLRRHLMTAYNMTPDEYRAKWNLPKDYPMVAPNYAETRRTLAKAIGLGTQGRGGGRTPAPRGRAKATNPGATCQQGHPPPIHRHRHAKTLRGHK